MTNRLTSIALLAAALTSATSDRLQAQDVPPAPVVTPPTGVEANAQSERATPMDTPPPSAQPTPERRLAPPPRRDDRDRDFGDDHPHRRHHHDREHSMHCRDCMPRPPRGDAMPAFFVGAGLFELTGLNKRLDAAGYDRIKGLTPVIGGELRVIHPNGLLTGFYGAAMLSNGGDGPERLHASWSGGFGMLDVGYAFVHLPGFTLSLSGGAGGYGATLDIYQRGDASFNSVLASPRRSTSIGVGGVLFGAVLRADGRIPLGPPRGDRQGYLALGLRVTGLWGPALGGWDFDDYDNDVDDGPSGNLAGVYAALVVGWGGTSINPTP